MEFTDVPPGNPQRALDARIAEALLARDATVATAESCTAGLVSARLADRPGSSAYLVGGFVTYANEAKTAELDLSPALLESVGAVSAEVAVAMAKGARQRLGTTYGLATTGVAGPGGGTAAKPVGLVHVAVATARRTVHRELRLDGDRAAVRHGTVTRLLELLAEVLAEEVLGPDA